MTQMDKTLFLIAAIFMTISFPTTRSFPVDRVLRQTNDCATHPDKQYLYTALNVAKDITVMAYNNYVINNTNSAKL